MPIKRRIFLVPLGNNNSGKTTIIRSLVGAGTGVYPDRNRKGVRLLKGQSGKEINSYIFARSYQETEKHQHGSVEKALKSNDPNWESRDLILMSSHVDRPNIADAKEIIKAANSAGFDVISIFTFLMFVDGDNRDTFSGFGELNWDEKWTLKKLLAE